MRHLSDSERLIQAALNRKYMELEQCEKEKQNYIQQLKALKLYIWELKESNKILAAQVKYLISKHSNHA